MNNTITLSQLIIRLKDATGVDANTARRFLRSFFATVEEALERGESVTVKDFGTFKPTAGEIGADSALIFIPDNNLSEELNRPFEMFEAVELADGVEFDSAEASEPIAENESQNISNEAADDTPYEVPLAPAEEDDEEVPQAEEAEQQEQQDEEESDEQGYSDESAEDDDTVAVESYSVYQPEETLDDASAPMRKASRHFLIGAVFFGIVVLVAAYFLAVFLTPVDPIEDEIVPEIVPAAVEIVNDDSDVQAGTAQEPPQQVIDNTQSADATTNTTETTAQSETVKAGDAAESASPIAKERVYDTVEISLIRLAVKHYGEKLFWVYIYDANSDIITNPNKIRPGTRVIIPDKSSFPGNDLDEARKIAKARQSEILSKYP